jgi:methionyl-tRNA formyltransferase
MALRVAFFGTPAFAVPSLARLQASPHEVVSVITQPDRPRGRGQKVMPGAVKACAIEAGTPVWQPDRLKDEAFLEMFGGLQVDLGVVAAYGRILSQRLLDIPRLGMINVHASRLPRWRGAAPVHRAVIAGDSETGVTIMRIVQALDAGPMLASLVMPIGANETSTELEARLAEAGAGLLMETVDRLASGPVEARPQDERFVTYAERLVRGESRLEWAQPASVVHNLIRGLQPWPLAAAALQGRRVSLLRSEVRSSAARDAAPGTIVAIEPDALIVATAPGRVAVTRVKMEGRAGMSVRDFVNGRRIVAGDRFEPLPDAP